MTKMTKIELASPVAPRVQKPKRIAPATSDMITIGKDVLELLSSAMYVDPLTIFREYVQNAADAIDDARLSGVLAEDAAGTVHITIDQGDRSIKIRDNGSGITTAKAASTLLSIGGSGKRGTAARGFRGVGRLAGLAYCRQLTFRTRARGDDRVAEVIWDCQKLKSTLRDVTQSDDLPGVMQRIVSIADVDGTGFPDHFFEVELIQAVRLRKDVLLNPLLVEAYLAQVAPIPFAENFRHAAAINDHLRDHVRLANLEITVGSTSLPIRRPHRDTFQVSETVKDQVGELELLRFEGDDGVSAVGWIVHHSYLGHITIKSQIGGLRLRAGNVQVGDQSIAEEAFPEVRFNNWAIGEIHVVDRRIVPNARRDHFEQNVSFANLMAELLPWGRSLAKHCRAASVERHRNREARKFDPVEDNSLSRSFVETRETVAKVKSPEAHEAMAVEDRIETTMAQSASPREAIAVPNLASRFSDLISGVEATEAEIREALESALTKRACAEFAKPRCL